MSDNSTQSGYNAGYLAWVGGVQSLADKNSDGGKMPPEPKSVASKKNSVQAPGRQEILSGVASRIAVNMQTSLTVPTATSFRTIPAQALEHNRRLINNHLQTQGQGRCSFTHLMAYALVQSLKALSTLNAHCVQRDGGFVRIQPQGINLGLAISPHCVGLHPEASVDSQHPERSQDVANKKGTQCPQGIESKALQGLVVPNIKDAQTLDFAQFVAAYNDLVKRARGGQLRPDDLQGTTITLTNPGGMGTEASLPRLMEGQGLIVACGCIGYPAAYAESDPALLAQLGISKVFTLSSTYDHRIIQGSESGLLLAHIHSLLLGQEPFYQLVFKTLGVLDKPLMRPLFSSPALETRVRSSDEGEGGNPGNQNTSGSRASSTSLSQNMQAKQQGPQPPPWVEFQHIRNTQERDWWAQQSAHSHEKLSDDRRLTLFHRLLQAESFELFLHKRFVGHKRFSLEGAESLIVMLDTLMECAAHGGVTEVAIGMPHRGRLNVLAHTIGKPYAAILAEFMGRCVPDERFALGPVGDVKYHAGGRGVYCANVQKNTSSVLERSEINASQNVVSAGPGSSKSMGEFSAVESAAVLQCAEVAVWMAHNPSHLESVNSVLQGMVRAAQDRLGQEGKRHVVPVLLHGDASFAGQGVVYESLQLARLPAYDTGGTVHIVVDNQIGYTTSPDQGRSCLQCTDIARAFDLPVLHVDSDDPEACIWGADLAFRARMHFGKDVLLHLIGYRRHGHNEGDDPSLTQPLLYRAIEARPSVAVQYGDGLTQLGVLSQESRRARQDACHETLEKASEQAKHFPVMADAHGYQNSDRAMEKKDSFSRVVTAVAPDVLRSLAPQVLQVPKGFHLHYRLSTLLQHRAQTVEQGQGIDMGTAETLAYASLLAQGVSVRLCGQDSERGTFAHRHAVLHDTVTGQTYTPLRSLRDFAHCVGLLPKASVESKHPERPAGVAKQTHAVGKKAQSFDVYNSPLSEAAALGFEYGYSVGDPATLVLWEAQFGDFCNGAQVHIDQYVAAGQAKWGQRSRVVLVLPHGDDGAGPEHSSARLERFLQLCAGDNLRVVTCVRAAQLFHLLRAQALGGAVPLVLLLPKSLLRSPQAASALTEFTAEKFEPVIAPDPEQLAGAQRLLLCSGKVFHELHSLRDLAARAKGPLLPAVPAETEILRESRGAAKGSGGLEAFQEAGVVRVAAIQVQQLYPFPAKALGEIMRASGARDVVWLQEEPKNMGAWSFCAPLLRAVLKKDQTLRYIGRACSASPATGYASVHQWQQRKLLQAAFQKAHGNTNDVEI